MIPGDGRKRHQTNHSALASNIDDSLPSPPNHDQLFAQNINKRKGPPMPPVRTTPLKELSLTTSFTMSNQSIMEESMSEGLDSYRTLSDDELLPLPPPEDLLTRNFDSLSLHDTSPHLPYRISTGLPPPILKNKPKRIDPILTKSLPLSDNVDGSIFKNAFNNVNNNNYIKSSSSAHKDREMPSQFSYLSLPKQNASKIPQNTKKDIKRVKSDQAVVKPTTKDFQSELRSRLKMQNKDSINDFEKTKTVDSNRIVEESPVKTVIGVSWATRKSMGHMRPADNCHSVDVVNPQLVTNILTPSNKRMSWTGGVTSLQSTVKKSTNITPMPSLSSANICGEEEDGDDFITKEMLLAELGSICQELATVNGSAEQSNESLGALVEKLETVHLGSTRYGNSSISAAKIKFKFIELCTNFNNAIESLRRSLKPYSHSSAVHASNGIKLILGDLKNLIENSQ